ncbi:amino acid adenylation domain-containing protein [Amycolatopsis jiangsuensis]|uniref:Amino acid adenylation domain-containing protein n=1 Tax=Amycolatopsis jiangsuensis TaxID=1181879 RepID=A0A840J5R4_9PSEU|nr:amino acid adenylation domain-containing protein [Amycolatopsis jiangsuensis]MBB4688772.1 amino acid adenylation domain-containing protein [Amycolatopsis jiangsuensis]
MTGQRSGAFPGATLVGEHREPAAASVVALIRERAGSTPDAVAIESEDGETTFRALWQRGVTIAAALREMGVRPGELVGVVARRSPESIAAMIAVMATGAAYAPIDPTNPPGRVRLILEQVSPRFVLWDGTGDPDCTFGYPGVDTSRLPAASPVAAAEAVREPRSEDVAYVVFTSGSTGLPKGVRVEHRSLVNYIGWAAGHVLPGAGGAACPVFASMSFDLALTSLWVPLAHGRTIVLLESSWNYASLFERRNRRYDFVKATPSHFRLFERVLGPDYRAVAHRLMIGGEPLEPVLLKAMGERLDGVQIVNHYGPTETTIGCFAHRSEVRDLPDLPTVPIGTPAWNTGAYVLDERGEPVPPGGHGELVVAGTGIARGYLGGDGGRFLDDPAFGGRAYRTGDIVEVLRSGALLHLGRADGQLKVNGHRFEEAELRRHALTLPRVADAAFDVIRGGTLDVVEAFVVFDHRGTETVPSETEIRSELATLLPAELVPRRVRAVSRIEVDANGKRDVRATREQAALQEVR